MHVLLAQSQRALSMLLRELQGSCILSMHCTAETANSCRVVSCHVVVCRVSSLAHRQRDVVDYACLFTHRCARHAKASHSIYEVLCLGMTPAII